MAEQEQIAQPKRGVGRPTKFDVRRAAKIIKAVSKGTPYRDAAQSAGVHPDTFNKWRNKGLRESTGEYHEFSEAIAQAEAEFIEFHAARIHAAARKDWKASAYLLGVHRPKQYATIRSKVEHTGENGAPIQTQNANLNITPAQNNHPDTIPAEVLPDQSAEDAVRKFFGLFPTYTLGVKPTDDSDDTTAAESGSDA